MGYTYCIRIAIDIQPDIYQNYTLSNELQRIYSLLQGKDDWFPTFGETEHSSSGGYGTGPNEHFYREIVRFTSLFPQYSFFVYFFYWDMQILEIFSIRDSDIQKIKSINFDNGISVPGGIVLIYTMKSL